jgi:hypothetical protein
MHPRRATDKDKFSLLSQFTISIRTNFAHLHILEHFRKFFYLLTMMFSTSGSRFFLVLAASFSAMGSAEDPLCAINLGKSGDYVVLTKTGISTVSPSHVTGNIGVSPITAAAMTGFALVLDQSGQFSTASQLSEGSEAHGASYGGVVAAELSQAISDMEAAYTDAAGRTEGREGETVKFNPAGGLLGASYGSSENPLTPGIYKYSTVVTITQDLHLVGDEHSVFIFQIAGVLTLAANKKVVLHGGVKAENVFWQVVSNVAIGVEATMQGILLVKTSIALGTRSTLVGRAFAQTSCSLGMATVGVEYVGAVEV